MLIATTEVKPQSFVLKREGREDFHFIPGKEYFHEKRGGRYKLIAITNTGATDPDYPPTVAYFNIETNDYWTKAPERFADGMKLIQTD